MENLPRVSIVMTSYNQERFVGPAITSILAQTFVDWELIVVDDGSRDRSYSVARLHSKQDPRIILLVKNNGGHCSAINYGLACISKSSDYIFFLDGDDLLHFRYLEVTVAYLDAHVEAGIVCCQADLVDGDGNILGQFHRSRWVPGVCGIPRNMLKEERVTPFVAFYCATGQGMSGLFRRHVFERTQGWDVRLFRHEDTDMFCQMALLSEVHYLSDRLYTYRIHGKNITCMSDSIATQNFETFKPGGYELFREKWDNRVPRNSCERDILDHARRYYYGIHRPLRFLRIALLSLRDFIRTGRLAALQWTSVCVRESLTGAMRYWFFNESGGPKR